MLNTEVRIKKSDYSGENLRSSSDWITQGHWTVRKDYLDRVKHAELFALATEMKDESMAQVIPPPDKRDKEYKITGEIRNETSSLDLEEDIVIFASGEGKPAGIKRKYVRMFSLERGVHGCDETSAFVQLDCDDKPWLVVMPMIMK